MPILHVLIILICAAIGFGIVTNIFGPASDDGNRKHDDPSGKE